MKNKILYAITVEDVETVSEDMEIPFTQKDLRFIEDQIGDFFGSQWRDAVEYALEELKRKRSSEDSI